MTGSPTSTSEDRIAVLRELDLVSNGRFADLDKLVMLALDICSPRSVLQLRGALFDAAGGMHVLGAA